MKANLKDAESWEFYDRNLDTLLRVEVEGDHIAVKASRNTFSPARKVAFVREMAAEGFIPDQYYWFANAESGDLGGVDWSVDASWIVSESRFSSDGRMRLAAILLAGAGVWIAILALILHH